MQGSVPLSVTESMYRISCVLTHIEVDIQGEHDIANNGQERQEDESSEHQRDDGRRPLLRLTLQAGASRRLQAQPRLDVNILNIQRLQRHQSWDPAAALYMPCHASLADLRRYG